MRAGRSTSVALGVCAITAVVASCSPDTPQQEQSPAQPPTPTSSVPTSSVPTSSAPTTPTPSPSPSVSETPDERDYSPPARDGSPDPSTAGRLSGATFPRRVLGFTAVVTQPKEGESDPNGTFVQAVDGDQAGREARAGCTADADTAWPTPRHALQASYAKEGAPGGGMALQFSSTGDATHWYGRYTADVAGCPQADDGAGSATLRLERGSDWMASRRLVDGSPWSEVTKRSGTTVVMIMVNDEHAASMDALTSAAKKLPSDS